MNNGRFKASFISHSQKKNFTKNRRQTDRKSIYMVIFILQKSFCVNAVMKYNLVNTIQKIEINLYESMHVGNAYIHSSHKRICDSTEAVKKAMQNRLLKFRLQKMILVSDIYFTYIIPAYITSHTLHYIIIEILQSCVIVEHRNINIVAFMFINRWSE